MRATVPEAKKAVIRLYESKIGFAPSKKDIKIEEITDDTISCDIKGKKVEFTYVVCVAVCEK